MVMWTPTLLWHDVLRFCGNHTRLIAVPPIAYCDFPTPDDVDDCSARGCREYTPVDSSAYGGVGVGSL
jgi:hypothetical protein